MRNFLQLAHSIDTVPVLAALAANPRLWNAHDIRTRYEQSPHNQADDILVFFNRIPEDPADVVDDIQTFPYEAWGVLPLKDMVLNLMRAVGGTQLGRVIISRLAPGASIAPHADQGAPADFFERYQIMLQCLPGVVFRSGNEQVQMATGQAWWFNNCETHEVINNSADDRIALIIDVRVN